MAHKITDKYFSVDVIHFDSGVYHRYSIFRHKCKKNHCFYESDLGLFTSDFRANTQGLKSICSMVNNGFEPKITGNWKNG